MNSGPGPRVFVGVDRSIPGLAALRFAVAEARRRAAPLYAVRVSEHLTLREAAEIDAAFAESMGGYPDDVVVRREILVGPVADTLTRRARYDTDVLIVGTHGGRRHMFGAGSISRACVRKARCPVLVVPGPEMAELLAARAGQPAHPGVPPLASSRPPGPARRQRAGRWAVRRWTDHPDADHRGAVLRRSWLGYSW